MAENDWAVIVALATVISGMAGFIVFLFKETIARQDRRIETLEKREDEAIAVMVTNIAAVLQLLTTVAEIARELKIVAEMDRRAGTAPRGGP